MQYCRKWLPFTALSMMNSAPCCHGDTVVKHSIPSAIINGYTVTACPLVLVRLHVRTVHTNLHGLMHTSLMQWLNACQLDSSTDHRASTCKSKTETTALGPMQCLRNVHASITINRNATGVLTPPKPQIWTRKASQWIIRWYQLKYLCILPVHACMDTGPCGALLHAWQLHAHVCVTYGTCMQLQHCNQVVLDLCRCKLDKRALLADPNLYVVFCHLTIKALLHNEMRDMHGYVHCLAQTKAFRQVFKILKMRLMGLYQTKCLPLWVNNWSTEEYIGIGGAGIVKTIMSAATYTPTTGGCWLRQRGQERAEVTTH